MVRMDKNIYVFVGEFCYFKILSKKHGELRVFIDPEDYPKVRLYRWSVTKGRSGNFYAHSWVDGKLEKLHRLITDFQYSLVDHVSRNSLDNRKCNLREASRSVNAINCNQKIERALPRNIYKKGARYVVQIRRDNKDKKYGVYSTIEEAVSARNEILSRQLSR